MPPLFVLAINGLVDKRQNRICGPAKGKVAMQVLLLQVYD
jgi:hypothetical protein